MELGSLKNIDISIVLNRETSSIYFKSWLSSLLGLCSDFLQKGSELVQSDCADFLNQ